MQSSRNHFTPFLPDVPVIQLPTMTKARRSFESAAALTNSTHLAIVRVCEVVILAAIVAMFVAQVQP
ncbi:hypothetical protein LAV84_06790 [Rhizobium sp. VS19-DR104.2]|uniref:hypothetical protein n=1 Tax=unclassified Rhizobium TaxID=2613769 RepID=UPI001CC4FC0B|nr:MULTISPECIES: hypothetical protein [unclassified Rhizobium]MBZ5760253.1 hypothetical protein [Rhizobium sp. VS19-DR96]MBZ5766903.1 hypothetical protein [Rhizobium sp. VS19-DR129.2]MBZ5773104.1 hypothetical protein [Rhizobium sp. VS19-DRK62.2]MBZ5784088.1 hypothetical protein [Rhizobium sp. VS19-DR121]MBZ5802448.1 hypothetical protein [Rhizobium sp. VS19-DR181]